MIKQIALYQHNAFKYLLKAGVAPEHLDAAIAQCPVAASFNDCRYYFPDDLDAVADVYADSMAERQANA